MVQAGGIFQSEDINIFEFNNVFRDGVQSNLGTDTSAEEITDMLMHTTEAEYASVQAGGGTFMDLFMKKGRDAWGQNTEIFNAFEEVITSALIRGDCVLGYERNPQDVIDAVIEELADRGLNVVTNFHGMNYAPMQEGVFKAVHKAREKSYDITAPKVICIEDNPNITIENCMAALAEQAAMGADSGIYLKNASGKCDPDFVYELTKRVAAEYPSEKITVHSHDNHGLAKAIYLRAGEAAAEKNAPIAFDVLPHPMAQGTAQPSAREVKFMFDNHPTVAIQARSPKYNEEAERADFPKQYETRHRYANSEVRYSKLVWDACYRGGMAGGAMAAIKGMGIPRDVKSAMKLADEDQAFAVVAGIEADLKALLGYPTSVTPYQKMMDQLSGFEAVWRTMDNKAVARAFGNMTDTTSLTSKDAEGKYVPFSRLTESAVYYLSGGLGPVPGLANPKAVAAALEVKGLKSLPEFVPADKLPGKMDAAKQALQDAGIPEPARADVALAAMYGNEGFAHVTQKINGELQPQQPPAWPEYLQMPRNDHELTPKNRIIHLYDVAMALGGPAELERFSQAITELEKHADGFYKTEIGPAGFYQRSLQGQGLSSAFMENTAEIRTGPEYLTQIHDRLKAHAEQEVGAFMEAIPTRLREYGFTPMQASAAMQSHTTNLLSQVVDRKAKDASKRSLPAPKYGGITEAYKGYQAPDGVSDTRRGRFNGATNGHDSTARSESRFSGWQTWPGMISDRPLFETEKPDGVVQNEAPDKPEAAAQ